MAPSLITHYEVYSPGADTSTLTTPSFTPANNEVIVVKLATWDTAAPMGAPSGGGQTYQAAQITAPGGFKGWNAVYVCTVSGSPSAFTISATMASATRHSMIVERWSGAKLDATPVVVSAPTSGSGGDLSTTITTSAADSVISWGAVDLNSRDPADRTWTPAATVEDGLFDGHIGSNSVQYFAYSPVPVAGSTAITLHVPAGALAWTIAGVEIKSGGTEQDLAANLSGMGSMTATLTAEADLSASLTGTGSMAATLSSEARLSASLSGSGTMSASLTVENGGPPDPIGDPVAKQLLDCLTQQMNQLPSPPAKIELRAGAQAGPLIGENVDECCPGLAWVRVAGVYSSWNNFPAEDSDWLPCGPLAYAVVLEMGTAFCMPWSDSSQAFDNMDPPSTDDWLTGHTTLMQHQTLMRRAAACCFLPTQRRVVGAWEPLSVEGGCMGGTLRVTVSVMAPCGDC